MRKFLILNLCFLLTIMCSSAINAQKYAVFGATALPAVNGVYVENGTYNSHPVYESNNYKMGYFGNNMKWVIVSKTQTWSTVVGNGDNYDVKYGTIVDSSNPPMIGWHHRAWSSGKPKDKVIIAALNGIGYHTDAFIESVQNDGSFNDTIRLYFYSETDHFTGADNDDFVAGGKVIVTNLPAGLTAKVMKTSDTTANAVISGTATSHSVADNIENLTLAFQNTAFSGNDASAIKGSTRDDLQIMFMQKFIVSNAARSPIVNGEYVLKGVFDKRPYYLKGNNLLHYKGCSPKWLIVDMNGVHPLYSSTIETKYPENFEWRVGGFFQVGEAITISSPNSIIYNAPAFFESTRDNGQFPDTFNIWLYHPESGNRFTGLEGEDYTGNGKILIQNTPAGLTPSVIKTSDTTLAFILTGAAASHTVTDNISNLSFELTNDAFSSGDASSVANSKIDTLKINYMQKFYVKNASTAAFNGIYTLQNMMNNKPGYYNSFGKTELLYRNTGNSFWVLRYRNTANAVTYSTPTATQTPPANGWHMGDYDGNVATSIAVTSLEGNWIERSMIKINETKANNGAIADTINIWLFSHTITLSGSDDEDFATTGKIEFTNLPEGLEAKAIRVDDKSIKLYFTGQALHNNPADAADSLKIVLKDNAFDNPGSDNIQFLQNNVKIVFLTNHSQVVQFDEGDFVFYPNPANTLLNIETSEGLTDLSVSVFNISGELLTKKMISSMHDTVDITMYPAGEYLLKAETSKRSTVSKFIIQH
jgi:hypothetical protein